MGIIEEYLKKKSKEPHIKKILKAKQSALLNDIQIWDKEIKKIKDSLKIAPNKYYSTIKQRLKEAEDEKLKRSQLLNEINEFIKKQ